MTPINSSLLAENIISDLASIPIIDSAIITNISNGEASIEFTYSVRNYRGNEAYKSKYEANMVVDILSNTMKSMSSPMPIDSESLKLKVHSPTGKFTIMAIKKKMGKSTQFSLQIFKHGVLIKVISIDEEKLHGDFYNDEEYFGITSWCETNSQFLYLAEAPKTKSTSSYEEYTLQESWGWQMSNIINPRLFLVDLESGQVNPIPTDLKISPSAATLLPDGNIAYLGITTEPAKLGLCFVYNRPTSLYLWNTVSKTSQKVNLPREASYRGLRYANGKLWLVCSKVGGSHFNASELVSINYEDGKVLTDTWQAHITEIFPETIQTKGNWIYFESPSRSIQQFFIIDGKTGRQVKPECTEEDSFTLLDVHHNECVALFTSSSPVRPPRLGIFLFGEGQKPLMHFILSNSFYNLSMNCKFLRDCKFSICQLDEFSEFLAIHPAAFSKNGHVITIPHGGPNSLYPTTWNMYVANFLYHGFTVITVNYAGSIGFGLGGIKALEGQIGIRDIADTVKALEKVEGSWGPFEKKFLFGGSHGGYIGAMLSAKYPKMFTGVILRNPVIDLPTMTWTSDIKDWTFGQLGQSFDLRHPRPATFEQLTRQYERSPSTYVKDVCSPTLVLLGARDVRVPPSQGKAWHLWLKANGVSTTALIFPDDDHSMDTAVAEKNSLLAIIDFLQNHTSK